MTTFLFHINHANNGFDEAWPVVLKCFDFSLELADEARRRDVAGKLLEVLDRLKKIEPEDLPGQAEVAELAESGRHIKRYLYFPTDEHAWVWRQEKGLGRAPEGKIALRQGGDNLWRFEAATVAGLAALYESMKNLPPKYVDKPAAKASEIFTLVGPTFERSPWWSWGLLLAGIFLGLLAGKIVQGVLRSVSEKVTRRGWEVRGIIFDNAAGPLSLALLSSGLILGAQFLYMERTVREFAGNIIKFLLILVAGWFLFNLVDVIDIFLRRLAEKTASKLDDQVVPLVRKTLRIFLVIVFALVVAQNVFGVNITAWLAGLGIAGLAVSLAAQDSVKNLFGSITIFFDKPFVIGDRVIFDGNDGFVEEIGFRSTRLRTLTGHLITVPNMKFIDNAIENVGARPYIRRTMNVTITYDTPPEKIEQAIQIIRDIFAERDILEPLDTDERPPRISFNDLNADSLNIRVDYWYLLSGDRDFWMLNEHAQRFNLKLFRAYGDAGIEFAFPTQTLYLAGDPSRQLAVRVDQAAAAPRPQSTDPAS